MLTIVYGLAAAVSYGAADFIGGLTARRIDAVAVAFFSQLFAAPLVAVAVALDPSGFQPSALLWGAGAGIAGGAGVILLYRGLGGGRMSIVAPVTALVAAAGPVLAGLLMGETPSPGALAGVVIALVAVVLVSYAPDEDRSGRSAVGEALLAGTGFAVFFILLDGAPHGSGMWPLVGARVGSLSAIGMVMASRRGRGRAEGQVRMLVATGVLDLSANLLYLLATRAGLMAIAAVLTSMYPASTLLLARLVLHERLSLPQGIGLGLGAAAVTLIALA